VRVAFIGLGSMGQPMALNLAGAGCDLMVYNRTSARAEKLIQAGARVAGSPQEAVRDADVAITMLSDDAAVEQIVFGTDGGHGALQTLKPGSVHVSMSTISVALSARLAGAHASARQAYIAAPVFGRPDAAAAGKLWIVAAGPQDLIDKCRPLFEAMGQGVFPVGENPASANLIKIGGNFMIASLLETLGEGFALVRKYGIDPEQFLTIMNSLFRSPVIENYGSIMAREKYHQAGFTLRLGLKDIRLVMNAADESGTPMPLASLMHDRFLTGVARGRGEIDWSGIASLIAEDAGLPDLKAQRGE
jgi:3-hydroxyisobutyrate dehydrogenase-like beta-hydroxyacid dehydrogenase